MNNKAIVKAVSALFFCSIVYIAGCKKQDYKLSTTDDVNITGYLQKNADSFSLFKQILDRTENSAFLDAYGSYTLFAPTNSGVTIWLASVGAANVEAANLNTLKELVKFHLLADTVTTGAFKDGRLPVPTMQGQYIITGVLFKSNVSSYSVNRQALVTKSNVKVGNGIIHEIDHMLVPASLTIAKQLEGNPNYSIFVQAMKETGYYDLLNTVDPDTTKRWMTVIAESNQALADSGYGSYAALKAKYSKTGNPLNVNDSLHMYMAYHILPGIKFLGDIITSASHLTLQPQEVISTQLINQEVIVNEDLFNDILEKGVLLKRDISDNSSTNGVWHNAVAHFMVKYRKPAAVFWDLSAFTEIMKLPAYYKKQGYTFVRQNEQDRPIKDIDWEYKGASNSFLYEYSTTGTLTNFAYNYDIISISLGGPNRSAWMEFTTPVVIKGRYKVWVCYRNRAGSVRVNVVVNGELLQRPINFAEGRPGGTDAELESIGWKRYTENTTGPFTARLAGTVDIKTTERHKLRFEVPNGGGTTNSNHVDMIHFIPVDDNQLLPRFRQDGTKIYL
ncbi:MAG: fasciclin domain-containing protein [Ferruginibacter sp.]|nr:fasciclin domain-containing protein [Ferruginibacter sp.]